jgi:hypothetical protein
MTSNPRLRATSAGCGATSGSSHLDLNTGRAIMKEWHPTRPATLSGYLEAMTRVIMAAGINWKVVEAKWNGIREAFLGFDVARVLNESRDVDRCADPRVIRNRRKSGGVRMRPDVGIELRVQRVRHIFARRRLRRDRCRHQSKFRLPGEPAYSPAAVGRRCRTGSRTRQ